MMLWKNATAPTTMSSITDAAACGAAFSEPGFPIWICLEPLQALVLPSVTACAPPCLTHRKFSRFLTIGVYISAPIPGLPPPQNKIFKLLEWKNSANLCLQNYSAFVPRLILPTQMHKVPQTHTFSGMCLNITHFVNSPVLSVMKRNTASLSAQIRSRNLSFTVL